MKPVIALKSCALVTSVTEHRDIEWPMTRIVKDAAYVITIIAGMHQYDNYMQARPFEVPPDYSRALNFSSLKGARIRIPRNGTTADNMSPALLNTSKVTL